MTVRFFIAVVAAVAAVTTALYKDQNKFALAAAMLRAGWRVTQQDFCSQ